MHVKESSARLDIEFAFVSQTLFLYESVKLDVYSIRHLAGSDL